MRRFHYNLRRFSAVILGIVFLVAGLLKTIDPVGTMLIVSEYCKFLHLHFLLPWAKGIGIFLAVTEASLGIFLTTGVFRKASAIGSFVLLGIFTPVTLILWIQNPNMDCGCFGEAIHLTHAQSFIKNVILVLLAVWAFVPFREFGRSPKRKRLTATVGMLSVLVVSWYSNTHLPAMDFTEFGLGAELFASLEDDLAADNHYEHTFIYEKNGQRGNFTLTTLPDSSWTFVAIDTVFRNTTAISSHYPILSFSDAQGVYHDRRAAEGTVVIFSVYDPQKADWERLQKQYHAVLEAEGTPYVLIASYPEEAATLDIPQELPLYFADYKTLITLNRSNGGGSYFCEGELINKWSAGNFPDDLAEEFTDNPIIVSSRFIIQRRLLSQGFLVYLAALLMLV